MSQQSFEQAAQKASNINELLEEVMLLDDLIALHQEHQSNPLRIQQYLDRRAAFIEELNELLGVHQLQLIELGRAA